MNKNNQKMRITLEKDVKGLGKVKTKIIENGVIEVSELPKASFLHMSYMLNKFKNNDELMTEALEAVFGKPGTVVVQDSTWKYTEMPLTVDDIQNFDDYQQFLAGVFDEPVIKQIYLPKDTKIIPSGTFAGQKGLEYVEFNEGLEDIGDKAFYECSRLGREGEIVLPSSLISIGSKAFAGTVSLGQDLVLGPNVEILGEAAFTSCGIYGISMKGTKIEVIPKACFKNAKNLTEVVLGNWVEVIGESAFEGADGLEEINTENVQEIGSRAFWVEGVSPVKTFDFSSLELAGKDIVADARNTVFALPDDLDDKMARNAGIPLIEMPKIIQVSRKKQEKTSVGLLEKEDNKRNAVQQIVQTVDETEEKPEETREEDVVIVRQDNTEEKDKKPEIARIGGIKFGGN